MTAQQKRVIDRAHRVRGLFVGSYAQVEYLLGNLWLALENVAPYFTKPSEFPFQVNTRIGNARKLFDIGDGPLFRFRDRAIPLFKEMEEDHKLDRHVMAHGYIDVRAVAEDSTITIRCFRPTKDEPAKEIMQRLSLNQMEANAKKAADFAGRWLKLMFDIHEFFGWVAPATGVVSQNAQGVVAHRPNKKK